MFSYRSLSHSDLVQDPMLILEPMDMDTIDLWLGESVRLALDNQI
jgi:hypothetical protein